MPPRSAQPSKGRWRATFKDRQNRQSTPSKRLEFRQAAGTIGDLAAITLRVVAIAHGFLQSQLRRFAFAKPPQSPTVSPVRRHPCEALITVLRHDFAVRRAIAATIRHRVAYCFRLGSASCRRPRVGGGVRSGHSSPAGAPARRRHGGLGGCRLLGGCAPPNRSAALNALAANWVVARRAVTLCLGRQWTERRLEGQES